MQDLEYELPRILIPRTTVNKGKKEDRGCYTPDLSDPSSLPESLSSALPVLTVTVLEGVGSSATLRVTRDRD
jgi:hypothetical protein